MRHWRRARRSEELERGARIERGLREGEGRLSAPHQAAALGLSLLGTDEKAMLQRLLGGAHRGLATAPLQLLAKLPEGLQLRVLGTVRERVLQAPHSVPRAKLSICTATLESVATLYGSSVGPITDAAHAHLLLVCTSLVPAVATSRGGLSAAAHDCVLKLLLALRPASHGRQQRLLLATLRSLPSTIPTYQQGGEEDAGAQAAGGDGLRSIEQGSAAAAVTQRLLARVAAGSAGPEGADVSPAASVPRRLATAAGAAGNDHDDAVPPPAGFTGSAAGGP